MNCLHEHLKKYRNNPKAKHIVKYIEDILADDTVKDKKAKILSTLEGIQSSLNSKKVDYTAQVNAYTKDFLKEAINNTSAYSLLNHKDTPTNPNPLRKFAIQAVQKIRNNVFLRFNKKTENSSKFKKEFMESLSDVERTAVEEFNNTFYIFNKAIDETFKAKKEDFFYQDLVQWMSNENGLPLTLKIAMHSAALELLSKDMYKITENSTDDIRRILGLGKEDIIPNAAFKILKQGHKADFLASDIGRKVLQRSGIKTDTSEATPISASQLEKSIGLLVLNALEHQGILEKTELFTGDGKDEYGLSGLASGVVKVTINENTGEEEYNDIVKHTYNSSINKGRGSTTFYSLKGYERSSNWELVLNSSILSNSTIQYINAADDALRLAPDVLSKLYGNAKGEKQIIWDKPNFTEKGKYRKTKKQNIKVTAEQAKNLETNERNSYELDETLSDILMSLPEELINELVGIRNDSIGLESKRGSITGKNTGLHRELANFYNFLRQKKDRELKGHSTKFYIKGEFWQVMRMGMQGLINPQMSKMHRSLFKMSGWDSTIDLNNKEHVDSFLSAIGALVDIEAGKHGGLIGQLKAVTDFFNIETNQKAVSILQKQLLGKEVTEADQKLLVNTIKNIDAPMLAFKGFTEYAKFLNAKQAGNSNFVTSAQIEIDGISNGVIMALIQLIPDNADKKHVMSLLAMGGYNFAGNNANIDELLGKKELHDAYMHMAQTMSTKLVAKRVELQKYINDGNKSDATGMERNLAEKAKVDLSYIENMSDILGNFTSTDGYAPKRMRSLVKYRIVSTIFGGSIYRQQQIFKKESIIKEGIEDKIQEVIKDLSKNDITAIYEASIKGASINFDNSIDIGAVESANTIAKEKLTKLFNAINGIVNIYNEANDDNIENIHPDLDGLFIDGSEEYLDVDAISQITLPDDVVEVLMQKGAKLYSDAMGEAIESEYASVITARESFTSATNMMVLKYNTMLRAAFDKRLSEIENSSEFQTIIANIDSENKRIRNNRRRKLANNVSIAEQAVQKAGSTQAKTVANRSLVVARNILDAHDRGDAHKNDRPYPKPQLTNKDIKEVVDSLKNLLPRVKTAFYNEDSDTGYLTLGKKQRRYEEDPTTVIAQTYSPKDLSRQSLTADSVLPFLSPPGVAAILNMLHMLDSTVANKAIGSGLPILNNHDGLSTSISSANQLNEILNTEHFNTMNSFSLGSAVSESLTTFNSAYEQLLRQGESDVTALQRLTEIEDSNAIKHYFSTDAVFSFAKSVNDSLVAKMEIIRKKHPFASDDSIRSMAAKGYLETIIDNQDLYRKLGSASNISANNKLTALFRHHDNFINKSVVDMAQQTTNNKAKVLGSVSSINQYSYNGKPVSIQNDTTSTGFIDNDGNEINDADIVRDEQDLQQRIAAKVAEEVANFVLLGSSNQNITEDEAAFNRQQDVDNKNVVDVYDDLVSITESDNTSIIDSSEHKQYLQNFLRTVTSTIMKPLQIFSEYNGQLSMEESKGNLQIYHNGSKLFLANKNTPRMSAAASLGIRMSSGEVYAHEIVHHVTEFGLNSNRFLYRQAALLYNTARSAIEERYGADNAYRVFMNDPSIDTTDPAYADEVAMAKERWDYIFNPVHSTHPLHEGRTTRDRTNEGIKEFVAFGTTNANLMSVFSSIDVSEASKKYRTKYGKLFERNLQQTILNFYNRIMSFITKSSSKQNYGKNVQTELLRLTEALSKTNSGNKNAIWSFLMDKDSRATAYSNIADEYVKGKARTYAASTKIGKLYNAVKSVPQLDNMASYQMRRVINWYNDGNYGFTSSVVTELRGNTGRLRPFHDLLHRRTLLIDAAKQNKAEVVQNLINSFTKEELNDEQKVAATKALLKTDLSSLAKHSSNSAILGFLKNDVFLKGRISTLETQLKQDEDFTDIANYLIVQAETLGHFMVTGKGLEKGVVMQNVSNIINLKNTGYDITMTPEEEVKAANFVDQLATLYAVNYLPKDVRKTASGIFENDFNALDKFLSQHNIFKVESANALFNGNKYGMAKGYTKTVVNPYLQFVAGSVNDKEYYASKGYVPYGSTVKRDMHIDGEKQDIIMYKSTLGSRNNYETAIASYTDLSTKGFGTHDMQKALRRVHPAMNSEINRTFSINKVTEKLQKLVDGTYVPNNNNQNQMIPKFDEYGVITDMRYMLSEHVKDTMLEQHQNIDYIMGSMFSDIIDKQNTPIINRELIFALKDIFDKEYVKYPTNFVEISRYSADSRYKSIYEMLPKQTKNDLLEVWGSNKMYVPKDVINLAFGSRKYSITESLLKDPVEQNKFEQAISMVTKFTLGFSAVRSGKLTDKEGLAITRAKRIESAIEQTVSVIKDNIVVRNIAVTRGNYASNIAQLKAKGIDIDFITTNTKEAITSVLAYQQAKAKLDLLQANRSLEERRNTYSAIDKQKRLVAVDRKISQLQDLLARNPSTAAMEMGLMPAIVDDVTTDLTDIPFKTGLAKSLDYVYSYTPEKLAVAGKTVFLTKDTEGYRVLNNAVKLTDYVGRYVLYKHYLSQGIKHADALSAVNEEFINFELPTHRLLDYANRLGLVWFSKYQLRVLKQIAGLLKEKPVTALTTFLISSAIGTSNIFNSVPGVTKGLFQMFNTPDAMLIDSFKSGVIIDLATDVL